MTISRTIASTIAALFLAISVTPSPAQQAGACDSDPAPARAGDASVVPTDDNLQHKNWQPQGGEIQFTIRSFERIPADAEVLTCFRWKTDLRSGSVQMRPSRIALDNDGKLLKVTTTVPLDMPAAKDGAKIERRLGFVPVADVRILAIKTDGKPAADVTTSIGVPDSSIAFALAGAILVVVLLGLYGVARKRLKHPGIRGANFLLQIISTPSGRASLSQLQIVVWTLVVAAAAVYVMASNGELLQITKGTLVLLGISGVAGIAAKAHSESQDSATLKAAKRAQDAKAEATETAREKEATARAAAANLAAAKSATAGGGASADGVAAANVAAQQAVAQSETATQAAETKAADADAAQKKADTVKAPPDKQVPRWSDLIVNETTDGKGDTAREIDVARLQMLIFTVIAAVFVGGKVLANYVIPEIPDGFQILIGISNAVYVGAKVAQPSS